jgi:hypothetical protein
MHFVLVGNQVDSFVKKFNAFNSWWKLKIVIILLKFYCKFLQLVEIKLVAFVGDLMHFMDVGNQASYFICWK